MISSLFTQRAMKEGAKSFLGPNASCDARPQSRRGNPHTRTKHNSGDLCDGVCVTAARYLVCCQSRGVLVIGS